mmetsp:Transcript_20908/g.45336  ORF Transcript_20908/g.45336 Transcript_20908/m.45336 type:complete len:203 (+) Transcript_20908:492-1100(+)
MQNHRFLSHFPFDRFLPPDFYCSNHLQHIPLHLHLAPRTLLYSIPLIAANSPPPAGHFFSPTPCRSFLICKDRLGIPINEYLRTPSLSPILIHTITTPDNAPMCHGLTLSICSHHCLLSFSLPIRKRSVANRLAGSTQLDRLRLSMLPSVLQCSRIIDKYFCSARGHWETSPSDSSASKRNLSFSGPLSPYHRDQSSVTTNS